MRKLLRDTIDMIRDAGGSNINIGQGGRHTRVNFEIDGRTEVMTLHRSGVDNSRSEARLRSQLRRKVAA